MARKPEQITKGYLRLLRNPVSGRVTDSRSLTFWRNRSRWWHR